MRIRSWETLAAVSYLIVCLVVGLVLARVYAPRPIVGVMYFEGLIDSASTQQMEKIMEAAGRDDRLVGVVIEINSPGGDASGSEQLYHTMLQLRQRKPVVVALDGLAASGGYYMAVAGNKIYASASASVGNVGARTYRPFDPEISPDELSTGPYKLNGGSRFDQIRQLELVKDAFVSSVVHQRSRSPYNPLQIDARTLAEGHLYLGSEALAIGLIDADGSRSDAILAAAELGGVKKYQVVDLTDYLGLPFEPTMLEASTVQSWLDDALPGTVLLLDSRIPLAGSAQETPLIEWLYSRWGESPMSVRDQPGARWPFNRAGGSR